MNSLAAITYDNDAVYVASDVNNSKLWNNRIYNKRTLRRRLRLAIAERRLDVHYQPLIDLRTGKCDHFEALVRWTDPVLGAVSPAVFIPVAEQAGLMNEITEFVVGRALSDIKKWRGDGVSVQSVAVNISAGHISNEVDAQRLVEVLTREPAAAELITLELTETAMVQHGELALRCLQRLSDIGFSIALDDFGTGFSSLAHLLEFPIETIKFERSFIAALSGSFKCRAMLQSLIALTHVLDVRTVAEGVESPEELDLLKAWGCSFAQGYYFSKPIPGAAVGEYLTGESKSEVVGVWPARTVWH